MSQNWWQRARRRSRVPLRLEALEDRTLLNYSVSLDNATGLNVLSITAGAGEVNRLTMSLANGKYTFAEANGVTFDPTTGSGAANVSGAGTTSITVANADVD